MDLNGLLMRAVELGATDIHLKVGQPPICRIDGDLNPMADVPPFDDDALAEVLRTVGRRSPEKLAHFDAVGDLDIAYQDGDLPRFRVNAYRQRSATSFAFRVIPKTVPSFEQLNLPVGVQKLAHEHRGLILVTGATGSGKTTTLAAMIDYMNRNRKQHIITIEDPIE
ncbi:MAG: ATPase, T2SS/T4P/T4SS family, partial [Actinomycetota bacterium]